MPRRHVPERNTADPTFNGSDLPDDGDDAGDGSRSGDDSPTEPFPARAPKFTPEPERRPGDPAHSTGAADSDRSRAVVRRVVARVFATLQSHGIAVPGSAHRQAVDDLESAIASGELNK